MPPKRSADLLRYALAIFGLARGDRDVGAGLGKESGGARADGSRARGHDDLASFDAAAERLGDLHDCRDGRGVRAVGVEHRRDAHRAEECLLAAASSFSPADMSAPPMKIAVLFRSFGPRVKMHPCTRSRTSPSATPPSLMMGRPRVVGDDLIEDARKARAVELQQEFEHGDGG